MRSRLGPLLACALALALASCGATEDAERAERAFTGAEVAREFEHATGQALRETAGEDEAWTQLGLGLDPPASLVRRYGVFSVYVVDPGNEEALASLLANKATREPLEPDARGIRWERDTLSRTWIAYRLYGENVVLVWFSGSAHPRADGRWARLDAALATLDG